MANAHSISKRRTSNAHSNSMQGRRRVPDLIIGITPGGRDAETLSRRSGDEIDRITQRSRGAQQTQPRQPAPRRNQLTGTIDNNRTTYWRGSGSTAERVRAPEGPGGGRVKRYVRR